MPRYSKAQFKERIGEDGSVTFETRVLSVQEIAQAGLSGLNDACTDDIVEDGYMLEDLVVSASCVVHGGVVLKVTADASNWVCSEE